LILLVSRIQQQEQLLGRSQAQLRAGEGMDAALGGEGGIVFDAPDTSLDTLATSATEAKGTQSTCDLGGRSALRLEDAKDEQGDTLQGGKGERDLDLLLYVFAILKGNQMTVL
jgi:hypothetical protein